MMSANTTMSAEGEDAQEIANGADSAARNDISRNDIYLAQEYASSGEEIEKSVDQLIQTMAQQNPK